jgi:hypothetical protein
MSSKKIYLKKTYFLALFVFLFIYTLSYVLLPASAADLIAKRILIGSSFPSENTTHTYNFTTVTPSLVGSVQFQYCSNSPLFSEPCTAPLGLNVMSAGIASQAGLTGFIVSGVSSASNLIITRTPVADAGATNASYVFSNIINPSTANAVFYVRITVLDNINATGNVIDTGAVVFVTEDNFSVDAFVPPYLTFCKGVAVSLDCSNSSGFLVDFGEFAPSRTSTVTTQMSAATNDPTGYNIFVSGSTLLSGSNIIPGLLTQSASAQGTSQFGINLRSNSSPSVGANPDAGSVASGSPRPNYNTPNTFRYVSGESVANASASTGFNRYTISYIVNVSADQRPGFYATTLTYTAIASF